MIGVDLVYIPEFERQLSVGGKTFISRAFSIGEMKNTRAEHLAGLWAAKEAVIKAANFTPRKYTDISLVTNAEGKLQAIFGDDAFEISISHHGEYAVAIAARITE